MKKSHIVFLFFLNFLFHWGYIYGIDYSRYRFHTIPATPYYHGISSIVKDRVGRIWYNGSTVIFMYDGTTFTSMDDKITNLAPTFVWQFNKLFIDRNKNLFVATNNGLFMYNYDNLEFKQIIQGDISDVNQGEDDLIWIGQGRNIISFSTKKQKIIHTYPAPENTNTSHLAVINESVYYCTFSGKVYRINTQNSQFELFANLAGASEIRQVLEYKESLLVLTRVNGLYILDKGGEIKQYYPLKFEMNEPVNSKKIYIDSYGILWVGTQLGLFLIDLQTNEKTLLQTNLNDPYSLPHNSIWSIYPDPDDGVWIGTYGGKLAYISFNDNYVDYRTPSKGGLNNPIVSCFAEDNDGNIWIGTEGGGVNFWNRKHDTFSYYTHYQKNTLNYDLIKSLVFDSEKKHLKIASYGGGINEYNTVNKTFKDLKIFVPGSKSRYLDVYDFVSDKNSGIWASTPEGGLYHKYSNSEETEQIHMKDSSGNNIGNPGIVNMIKDKGNDNLWLFTKHGLFLFDVESRKIDKHYKIENPVKSENILNCHCMTSFNELWIGTRGGGVNLYKGGNSYKNFNEDSGFPAKTVFSILEDKATKNIWFATDNGLICYDLFQNQFQKVDIVDSQIYGSFYPSACYQTVSGDMLFGGTNGFIVFNPAKTRINKHKPKVFITDLYINNKKILPGEAHSPLSKDIAILASRSHKSDKEIVLSYNQSNIGISFSSDSYMKLYKNRFACRLQGISDEWQLLPSGQHNIQYPNLPPGEYVFEIKSANNDGLWGDEVTKLYFNIKPAPWFSFWARAFYFFAILGVMYFVWKYFSNKKEFKHNIELEKLEKQKMNEITQMRINFFTNISHDLKTPLTLILDPLKRLEKTMSPDHPGNSYRLLVEQNVKRIQRMINQLLEFRKIESKKIDPDFQTGDIISYTSDLFNLFVPYASGKHMITEIDSYYTSLTVMFDPDLIEKIFSNLFSNAAKYSPEGESIIFRIYPASTIEISSLNHQINTQEEIKYITFEVINTGVTIPKEHEKRLFEPFSRLSNSKTNFQESSGLGLSIVNELVQALGGTLLPDLRQDEVAFRVVLPLLTKSQENPPKVQQDLHNYEYTLSELRSLKKDSPEEITGEKDSRLQKKLVVIEDDDTLNRYLVKELSLSFMVFSAKNGQEGIELVKKINPQVVITDLMMPELDGLEVCKRLKENLKTSHIPIIMLSAMNHISNRLDGLREGADVFIEKPFDVDFLIQQIKNLIQSREKLKELYSQRYVVEPSQVVVSSMDEVFFKKAIAFVEKNIQNPDYDVESFVSDMAISRTLLYQKINDSTGMTIKEFILDMKLKRAAQLLKNSQYNISEIATMTGFNDSKYFSTCFKKHYGKSPSEFKSK